MVHLFSNNTHFATLLRWLKGISVQSFTQSIDYDWHTTHPIHKANVVWVRCPKATEKQMYSVLKSTIFGVNWWSLLPIWLCMLLKLSQYHDFPIYFNCMVTALPEVWELLLESPSTNPSCAAWLTDEESELETWNELIHLVVTALTSTRQSNYQSRNRKSS